MDILDISSDDYDVSEDERRWGSIAHFSALIGFAFPIMSFLAPLGVYLYKGPESSFIKKNAAAAFNFQIAMFIASILAVIFAVVTFGIGFIAVFILLIVDVIGIVKAGSAAQEGEIRKYPFSINILK